MKPWTETEWSQVIKQGGLALYRDACSRRLIVSDSEINGWIPIVTDQLITSEWWLRNVPCLDIRGSYTLGYFDGKVWRRSDDGRTFHFTHWYPLPQPKVTR